MFGEFPLFPPPPALVFLRQGCVCVAVDVQLWLACVDQADLELKEPPVSASKVLSVAI